MLLPAPVLPTSVTCSPSFTRMEKPCNTGFSPYPKVTSENTMSPRAAASRFFGTARSSRARKVSMRFTPAMAD